VISDVPGGKPIPVPDTTPTGPTELVVTTEGLLEVHVPLPKDELSVLLVFWQNEVIPLINGAGAAVIFVVVLPHRFAAVITVVPPAAEPEWVTTPVTGFTVATPPLLLVQVPVGNPLLLSVVARPKHTVVLPEIIVGCAVTVTVSDAGVPQPLA
jgi:hypothetical protein